MFLQGKIRAGKVALRESQSLRTRDVSESRQCAVLVHHDKTFWAKQAASRRQTCRGIHARTHEDQSMRAHACMGHAHACRHTCAQGHMHAEAHAHNAYTCAHPPTHARTHARICCTLAHACRRARTPTHTLWHAVFWYIAPPIGLCLVAFRMSVCHKHTPVGT